MKAVSDSSILMHLAKIEKINFLKKLFDRIIIEKEVYNETIERGEGHSEIIIIKSLIDEGFIIVKEATKEIEIPNLHEGERKSIFLCKELNIKNLLIDDEEGFNVAAMLGLVPIRATSILIILLDRKLINLKDYENSMKRLSESGYFLDALTYDRLLTIGKNIAK